MIVRTGSSPVRENPKVVGLGSRVLGAVAQLGERIVRNDEVGGSNPPSSTKLGANAGEIAPASQGEQPRQSPLRLHQLDQVATGVVEDRNGDVAHFCWLHREIHASRLQFLMLCMNVRNTKGVGWDALVKQPFLIFLRYRIFIWFKQ